MDQTLNPEMKLEEIRSALERILASRTFRAARGQKKFLAYTVEQALAGHAHLLKEYVIATDALGRKASFDPRLDPIVRTEARKLRARLAKYYETEGLGDPLRVEFRKGSYVPFFHDAVVTPAAEPASETETPPTSRAPEPPSIEQPHVDRRQPRWKVTPAYFAVLVLAVSSVAILYRELPSRLSGTTFAASDASVAVLPLVNLSDKSKEFLSDGLTEQVIDSLRQVPNLRVVARPSTVAQKLHVRAVLVGTVSKVGNRLRVEVQLNDPENGYPLWSGSYERESSTIGTIPLEIANAITKVLGMGVMRGGG